MKSSIFAAVVCLFVSNAAWATERDTGGGDDRDEVDRGPGGTRLAFDLDYTNRLDSDDAGMGGAVRFGREYDVLLLSLTPEFMGGFHTFSGTSDLAHFAGLAGGRATIGKIIEPGVFAHVGAGHVNLPGDSLTGLALDLGVTLDLTLIPAVDLGVHGAYDSLSWSDRDTFDWYRVGAHVAIAP